MLLTQLRRRLRLQLGFRLRLRFGFRLSLLGGHNLILSWVGLAPGLSQTSGALIDIQIILGEELDETGGDGGGIPARQVVARTRYRHRVDFWNPLLQ